MEAAERAMRRWARANLIANETEHMSEVDGE
jgi:hypothetical protein